MKTPASVRAPTCQTLGFGEGFTLSVVKAMPRKSQVIMMTTISIGVRIACPVITSPAARKTTCTIFLVTEFIV